MIKTWIVYLNKKWDNMPEPRGFITMVIVVAVLVFGITSKIILIKSIAFILLMIFCLIRIYGSTLKKSNKVDLKDQE